MTTVLFVALATVDPAGGYQASFPDLPDCQLKAPDIAQLLGDAREALSAQLQRIADAGEAWPAPTPIEKIPLAPGVIPLLVDVAVEDTPIRVNISLGERLVQRLDAAAEARGMTRSGFIAQAVRVSLGERGPAKDFDAATKRLQEELESLGRRINDSIGPNSAFGRGMANLDDQVYDGVRKMADSVSAAMTRRREARQAGPAAAPADPPAAA
ncbi:MAG TPA: type II toxin-antitoxin system HicB family antitoxin [Caulobacteraceae bacterium]|nr:type II toxin-antitoxin system HicB family antitoxin [Caulobacteraceae bacterium]